ncbi:hypothetical protein ACP4OV_030200 [Aristida adscensionis]
MAAWRSTAAVAAVALLLVMAQAASAGLFSYKLCGVDKDSLEACRAYCTLGSTAAKPTDGCCAAMGGADLDCLCDHKDTLVGVARSQNIDPARAMAIPYRCGITSTPVSC